MMRTHDAIIICPMSESDLDQVLSIESVSFPRPWNREHFLAELESPHAFPLVAMTGEQQVAGYICPMLVVDEGHILDVAVHPAFRGHGIGRLLVEKVMQECSERGAEYISLEVRTSNTPAISLYSALGFIETGVRKRYYENGEDALIMEYQFS